MVSWSELSTIIQKNTYVTFNVPHITLQTDRSTVPVVTLAIESPRPVHVQVSVPVPVPSNVMTIAPAAPKKAPAPATAPTHVPTAKPVVPKSSGKTIDPIVIGIENNDPLYNSAPRLTKHQMEIEEAQRLETMMNEVYSKESGRSRGWTKSGLEQLLKARCASGGDSKELERARVSFPWKLIRDDKLASAFLDFVCVCKHVRVAVWDIESKIVALYPAADPISDSSSKKSYPLYHVNTNGELMFGSSDLIQICDSNKFVLMPPLSVLKSLSGLILDELANVASQLGMAGVEGNKAERVATIASFKVRSRLM